MIELTVDQLLHIKETDKQRVEKINKILNVVIRNTKTGIFKWDGKNNEYTMLYIKSFGKVFDITIKYDSTLGCDFLKIKEHHGSENACVSSDDFSAVSDLFDAVMGQYARDKIDEMMYIDYEPDEYTDDYTDDEYDTHPDHQFGYTDEYNDDYMYEDDDYDHTLDEHNEEYLGD